MLTTNSTSYQMKLNDTTARKTALNLPGNVTKLIFQSPNQIQFNWTIWKVPRRHPITDFHNIQTPTQIHPENRLKKPQRWQQLRILMSFSGR